VKTSLRDVFQARSKQSTDSPDIKEFAQSIKRSFRAQKRAAETTRREIFTVELFADLLIEQGVSTSLSDIEREHMDLFIGESGQALATKD